MKASAFKARNIFDAISVFAAAAAVTEQAVSILSPFFKGVEMKAPAFLPAIVREVPQRTANAFAAFTTSPGEFASAQRKQAPSGGGARTARRPMPPSARLTHKGAANGANA